jgi:hypothetical protein
MLEPLVVKVPVSASALPDVVDVSTRSVAT